MHISTRCTCNGKWGDCELDFEYNPEEWVIESIFKVPEEPGRRNDYVFRNRKLHLHVCAEHIEGNRYAVNSFWS